MPTNGAIYAAGRITNPAFTEEAFDKWYSTEHIPQVLTVKNGPKKAYRFKNADFKADGSKAPFEYLAVYPVDDIDADFSDMASKVKLQSDLVPDGKSYLEFTDWDVRYYEKIETLQGNEAEDGKVWKSAIVIQYEPDEADQSGLWYDEQYLQRLRNANGYIRSCGFRIKETRAASGREGEDRAAPKFLEVHEFDRVAHPRDHIEFDGPDDSRPAYKTAQRVVRDVWILIHTADA